MNAIDRTTGCECDAPGFCQRHRCSKPPHLHMLCRSHMHYFMLWERGDGPCIDREPFPQVVGLGDLLEWLFRIVTFNLLRPRPGCRCANRKAWLNRTFPFWIVNR